MAKKKKSEVTDPQETFVWKVVPVGDGSFYGWKKFNAEAEVVDESVQHWPDALTVEKVIRSLAAKTDRIEVEGVHNINTEDNQNVDLVKPKGDAKVENAGMTKIKHGVEERAASEAQKEEDEDKK